VSDNATNMKKAFNLEGILKRLRELPDLDDTVSTPSDNEDSTQDDSDIDSDMSDFEDEESLADSTADFMTGLGWSPCLSHTVQLVINVAIKSEESVVQLISEVNHIITFFRRSPKWLAVYRKEVKENCACNNNSAHELIQPNTTRWNSTFSALERISKVK